MGVVIGQEEVTHVVTPGEDTICAIVGGENYPFLDMVGRG